MSDIIVASIEQAECAEYAEPGHAWVVEGDFGFLLSSKSRAEAYNFANAEAANCNSQGIEVNVVGNE